MYDDRDDRDWVEHLKTGETWVRGAFVVLFVLVLWFIRIVLALLAALQFAATLVTGRPVALALPFGRSLSFYIQEIALFVTYNSDQRPWPWSAWPEPGEGPEGAGFGPEEEEPPAATKPRRRGAAPSPAEDVEGEPITPPPATEPDAGPGDSDGEDTGPPDDSTDPRRPRKRKSASSPAGDDGAASPGEPPRPDA